MRTSDITVHIIGAGLSGLSAAITLARGGVGCTLVSLLPSERSQSVLAEGGINGALNAMGEGDTPEEHYEDTMRAGVGIANPEAVRGLTQAAPDILRELRLLGVPFNIKEEGKKNRFLKASSVPGAENIEQRNFGGQKKKRTAYARSSTGKALMTALIDEARRYEAQGLITRFSHHELEEMLMIETAGCNTLVFDENENELAADGPCEEKNVLKSCIGVAIRDTWTREQIFLKGPVILATGGLNGVFPGRTTGTVTNSGNAAALAFSQGVRFSNLEMIQYHPTTIGIAGKRCLVSEAARGEGGRLFIMRQGSPWYFMEEKYPELGNLSPRDVVAREMFFVAHDHTCEGQVWLDMRHLSREIWERKLPDLRAELIHYLAIDPAKEPIPVEPGIHYFMGGIDVDIHHRTNVEGLYAAGECCSQYHGANRLGGNSTMGAIYGGRVAAEDILERLKAGWSVGQLVEDEFDGHILHAAFVGSESLAQEDRAEEEYTKRAMFRDRMGEILYDALGIVRREETLKEAMNRLTDLKEMKNGPKEPGVVRTSKDGLSWYDRRLLLAHAMLESAIYRKESRGAHYREDYPETSQAYQGMTVSEVMPQTRKIQVYFRAGR